MNDICKRIIDGITLSVEQADEVCRDLNQLDTTGIWDMPAWAVELGKHYSVSPAHSVVQVWAWKAVAKAYLNESLHNTCGENDEQSEFRKNS